MEEIGQKTSNRLTRYYFGSGIHRQTCFFDQRMQAG
jgi:hypothetical protein